MSPPWVLALVGCWVSEAEIQGRIASVDGETDVELDTSVDTDAEVGFEFSTIGSADDSYQSADSSPPWGEGEVLEDVEAGATLHTFAAYLSLNADRAVEFAVYESTDFNGSTGIFTRVWTDSIVYSAGTGFGDSPAIDLPLDPQSSYLVASGGLEVTDDRWFSEEEYPANVGFAWATGYYALSTENWPSSFVAIGADAYTTGVGYTEFEYTF